jgi:hypothetical protein
MLDNMHNLGKKFIVCGDFNCPPGVAFKEGCFPSCYKTARLLPLLKKQAADPSLYQKTAGRYQIFLPSQRRSRGCCWFNFVLQGCTFFCKLHSAYHAGHATETALVETLSGAHFAGDCKKITVIFRLDISAAFVTISHGILLDWLSFKFGISQIVLDWLRSYLVSCRQFVKIKSHSSPLTYCSSGVPQGIILGPILFVYMCCLSVVSFPAMGCGTTNLPTTCSCTCR